MKTRRVVLPVLLAVAVSALLGALTPGAAAVEWNLREMLVLVAVALIALAPFVLCTTRGSYDLFEPVFQVSAITLVSFVAVPVWMLWKGSVTDQDGFSYRPELASAVALSGLGLLAFYAGYYGWGAKMKRRNSEPQSQARILPRNFRRASRWAFAGLLAAVSFFLLWLRIGGVSLQALNALGEESYYRAALTSADTSATFLYMVTASWPAFLLLAHAHHRGARGLLAVAWLVVFALYVVSGNRGPVLRLLVATAVYAYLGWGRRPKLWAVMAFIVAFAALGGFVVIARSPRHSVGEAQEVAVMAEAVEAELTVRGAALGTMILVRVFPDMAGYLHWRAFEEVLVAPIPRALWPGKPGIRSVLNIAEQYVPRAHAPAFFGPYYAGFGAVGVTVSMMAWGAGAAWVYWLWKRNPASPLARILLAVWTGLLWELYHRGGVVWMIVNLVYSLGPILLIAVLARSRSRVGSGAPTGSLQDRVPAREYAVQ